MATVATERKNGTAQRSGRTATEWWKLGIKQYAVSLTFLPVQNNAECQACLYSSTKCVPCSCSDQCQNQFRSAFAWMPYHIQIIETFMAALHLESPCRTGLFCCACAYVKIPFVFICVYINVGRQGYLVVNCDWLIICDVTQVHSSCTAGEQFHSAVSTDSCWWLVNAC